MGRKQTNTERIVGEALLWKHRDCNAMTITVVYCCSHVVQHCSINWKALISVIVLTKISVQVFLPLLNKQHQGKRVLLAPAG